LLLDRLEHPRRQVTLQEAQRRSLEAAFTVAGGPVDPREEPARPFGASLGIARRGTDSFMSGPAAASEPSTPRLLVLDDGQPHEVFDVLALEDGIARVRSPFLFEVGEELAVRIEADGRVSEATARVRAHVGPDDARITELELWDRTDRSE
jgi:hypothetical protein